MVEFQNQVLARHRTTTARERCVDVYYLGPLLTGRTYSHVTLPPLLSIGQLLQDASSRKHTHHWCDTREYPARIRRDQPRSLSWGLLLILLPSILPSLGESGYGESLRP